MNAQNPMKKIGLHQVTVNMGVGEAGDELKKAMTILERVTGAKPTQTICKVRQPTWGLTEGLPIGTKVTLRNSKAENFLKGAFAAIGNTIKAKSFDRAGNFGFGIKEYIDIAGVKYDPKLGIRGMDVLVSLARPGYRVKRRKLAKRKMGVGHAVTRDEAIAFVRERYGVEIR